MMLAVILSIKRTLILEEFGATAVRVTYNTIIQILFYQCMNPYKLLNVGDI